MDPQKYYNHLWKAKGQSNFQPAVQRDWLHRFVIDPIFDPTSNSRHEVALSLLNGGLRLLDIGCWDGRLLEHIQEACNFQELYGVDVVPEGIDTVLGKGFQAQIVDLNYETLPFPDEHFDAITMLAVLEHLFDPFSVIREIYRVLLPGGELIIDVPNVASFTNRIRILFGRLPITSGDEGWDGGHLHYFTKHALDRFLNNEGFEILVRKTSGGRPRMREWWISMLGGELIYLCRKR